MGRGNFRQRFGAWGERQAEGYLIERGLEVLDRNFRTPSGEIDLVMRHGDQIVFVEVKTRSTTDFGMPEESVTESKQEHLLEAAQLYLDGHPEIQSDWRVDVISIIGRLGSGPVEIVWFENALG